jgi:hypothetical protein
VKASDFVGLTKKAAQDKAEARNMVFRHRTANGEKYLGDPSDPGRDDRVCVDTVDGKVTAAEIT